MYTIKELLGRKSSGSGLENRDYCVGIGLVDHSKPFYLQKLALTSPTSNRRSVGIVRSRTQAKEFSFSYNSFILCCFDIFVATYMFVFRKRMYTYCTVLPVLYSVAETAVARQWLDKRHVTVITLTYATT
jgi:hypothetical protein